jgi:hypothetical protein
VHCGIPGYIYSLGGIDDEKEMACNANRSITKSTSWVKNGKVQPFLLCKTITKHKDKDKTQLPISTQLYGSIYKPICSA